jgi:hypothetical protein
MTELAETMLALTWEAVVEISASHSEEDCAAG